MMWSDAWLNPIKKKHTGIQKIGLEMEMFVYDKKTWAPIGLPDSVLTPQILLERIAQVSIGSSVERDLATDVITMVTLKDGGNFSCEPGGQLEYSSVPAPSRSELILDVQNGLKILEKAAADEAVFFSHGTNPIARADHPLLLPKERYQIMTRYFESAPKGIRGIDMMRHSATVQANVDVFGEGHWQDAANLTLVLIPLTRMMFSNSRYFKNQKSLHTSERQSIWENMDPSRSGYPIDRPFLQPGFHMEHHYADWAMKADVFLVEGLPIQEQPLYGELTFEQWMKQQDYKGVKVSEQHWETHLATLFPHLRLRDFLEIRHIDAQPFEHTFAPVAFFSALIQSEKARKRVWEFVLSQKLDLDEIFHSQEDFSFLHEPLLDLCAEILSEENDPVSLKSIQAYKGFLSQKESYWSADNALDFVVKNATQSPSEKWIKFLN